MFSIKLETSFREMAYDSRSRLANRLTAEAVVNCCQGLFPQNIRIKLT